MSFNYLLKKSSASTQSLQIRKEVVSTKTTVRTAPRANAASRSNGLQPPRKQIKYVQDKFQRLPSHTGKKENEVTRKRRTPSQGLVNFSSDDSEAEDGEEGEGSRKKPKADLDQHPDLKRQVRNQKAFSEEDGGIFDMVHAADIPSLDKTTKYIPSFEGLPEKIEVSLQYPSASQRERYLLMQPRTKRSDNNDFNALEDIVHVMHQVIAHYLPPSQRELFDNDVTGYPKRLHRAINHKSEDELKTVIKDWNDALSELRSDGVISAVLDEYHSIRPDLVERVLSQACARTVSLGVKSLREYENGTDNVYGELLPRFVSRILKEDTHLNSDQVFVDLGSGVGNVVLQAALEVGCESWGCEMMKNTCDLAEQQQTEFEARCRLWGLAPGDIHLERGDFLSNAVIAKILPKADVVLVNNQAFTPQLNERLTSLFLDLKEGCRIVSLKSFVPAGHKISARNLYSPFNVLEVEQKEYFSECVSWTAAPGTYYVSRKDSRKIKAFAARNE
ncbi:Nucleosomal histone H3-Lys79 methylase [Xylographa carneopallida]|nr:Nucleosomal histone H3-Lys79 methylase [Xylographa carneopallida]